MSQDKSSDKSQQQITEIEQNGRTLPVTADANGISPYYPFSQQSFNSMRLMATAIRQSTAPDWIAETIEREFVLQEASTSASIAPIGEREETFREAMESTVKKYGWEDRFRPTDAMIEYGDHDPDELYLNILPGSQIGSRHHQTVGYKTPETKREARAFSWLNEARFHDDLANECRHRDRDQYATHRKMAFEARKEARKRMVPSDKVQNHGPRRSMMERGEE